MNNTCVAFGSFEFVHKGHRKIAEKVVEIAGERSLTPAIVCLEKEGKTYSTEEEKEYLLKQLGVEMVLTFGKVTAKELLGILAAKVVVIGEQSEQLEEVKAAADVFGIEVVVVATEMHEGQIITAELVEKAYENSDYELFEEICGHPYIMIGEVVHGKALGRTENMPTANVQVSKYKMLPKDAVYYTVVRLGDEVRKAVTNIGKRPTVDNYEYVTVEALILDFERNIYGEKLVLEVRKFIRDIKKFETLAEVKNQVDQDVEQVRNIDFTGMK